MTGIIVSVTRQISLFPGRKAMILYIVRHAIAEAAGTSDYEDDSQRPLCKS